MRLDPDHLVTDPDALQALYGEPGEASLKKEVDHVHPHYRAFIEASPFAMLATAGPDGLDASPRGDPAGFVVVEDENPAAARPARQQPHRQPAQHPGRPTRRPAVPGAGRGRDAARQRPGPHQHRSSAAGALRHGRQAAALGAGGRGADGVFPVRARCCSRLWDASTQVPRSALPSAGRILSDLTAGTFDGVAYDRDFPARVAKTLY